VAIDPGAVVTGLSGSYRVEARHREGSFGVTYRASDVSSGATVIVKELRIEKLDDWKALELFEREGRVLASLSHPSIPAFRDFFAHGAATPLPVSAMSTYTGREHLSLVLVQQFIEGTTLQQHLDEGDRLSPSEAEGVLRALLQALRHLHDRSPPLVHRDIKPGNVIMTPDGRPYLVDFGAIQDRIRTADTAGSTIVGTLGYMPLEQLRGQARPASDLYALGVTMVVALAGRPPEQLEVDESTGKIAIERAVPPETPPVLRDVLDGMIAVVAGQRIPSASDVLRRLGSGAGRGASPVPTPLREPPRARHARGRSPKTSRAEAGSGPLANDEGDLPIVPMQYGRSWVSVAVIAGGCAAFIGGAVLVRAAASRSSSRRASTSSPALPEVKTRWMSDDCTVLRATGCAALAAKYERLSPPDTAHAVDAHRLGCTGGDGRECGRLGHIFGEAKGVKRDSALAATYYERACDLHDADGCNFLGTAYVVGSVVAKDDVRAATLYKQACDLGDASACNHLGWRYVSARGIARDPEAALMAFEKSCNGGNAYGCDSWAYAQLNTHATAQTEMEAVGLFERGCAGGVSESCVNAGFMYLFGRGTPADSTKAADLFRRGCPGVLPSDQESKCWKDGVDAAEECAIGGLELSKGVCGQTDPTRAAALMTRACRDGWTWACDRAK